MSPVKAALEHCFSDLHSHWTHNNPFQFSSPTQWKQVHRNLAQVKEGLGELQITFDKEGIIEHKHINLILELRLHIENPLFFKAEYMCSKFRHYCTCQLSPIS